MRIDEGDESSGGRGEFAVSRRNLLKGFGATAVATSLAGCVVLPSTDFRATPLGWIELYKNTGTLPGTISFQGHQSRKEERTVKVLGVDISASVTAEATGWLYDEDEWRYRVGVLSIPQVQLFGQTYPIKTPVDGPPDEVLTRDTTRELFNTESGRRLKTLNLDTVMEPKYTSNSWNPPVFVNQQVAGRRGTGTTAAGETYNVEAFLVRGTTPKQDTSTPDTTLLGVVRMQNAEDGDLPEDNRTEGALLSLGNNIEVLDNSDLEELKA